MKKLQKMDDELVARFLITAKNCPIPTQRDLILWVWETMKPVIFDYIERNYRPKKKSKKQI